MYGSREYIQEGKETWGGVDKVIYGWAVSLCVYCMFGRCLGRGARAVVGGCIYAMYN